MVGPWTARVPVAPAEARLHARPPRRRNRTRSVANSALLLALGAAFVHAFWNVLLARARDPEAATAVAVVVAVVVFAPVAAAVWEVDARVWPFVAASAALELLYYALLAAAYRRAELS